jgi:hypothetical protein
MLQPSDRAETGRRRVRLPIEVTDAELTAIDDYRSAKHVPSRSEAVRRLLMTGMFNGDEPDQRT